MSQKKFIAALPAIRSATRRIDLVNLSETSPEENAHNSKQRERGANKFLSSPGEPLHFIHLWLIDPIISVKYFILSKSALIVIPDPQKRDSIQPQSIVPKYSIFENPSKKQQE